MGLLLALAPAVVAVCWTASTLAETAALVRTACSAGAPAAATDPGAWLIALLPSLTLLLAIWWAFCGIDELRRTPRRRRGGALLSSRSSAGSGDRRTGMRRLFWFVLGLQAVVSFSGQAHALDAPAEGSTPLFEPAPATASTSADRTDVEGQTQTVADRIPRTASDSASSGSPSAAPGASASDGSAGADHAEEILADTSLSSPLFRSQKGTEGIRTQDAALPYTARQEPSDSAEPTAASEEVVVLRGDTLWSIAGERAPGASDADVLRLVHRIQQINHDVLRDGPDRILPGTVLRVPAS